MSAEQIREGSAERQTRDPYEVLGVGRNFTDAELKHAYRILAMEWHPDRNPHKPQAAEKFIEISQAYATLSDPEARARYDAKGEGVELTAADACDLAETIFGDIFQAVASRVSDLAGGRTDPRSLYPDPRSLYRNPAGLYPSYRTSQPVAETQRVVSVPSPKGSAPDVKPYPLSDDQLLDQARLLIEYGRREQLKKEIEARQDETAVSDAKLREMSEEELRKWLREHS